MHAMAGDAVKLVETRQIGVDAQPLAKAFGQHVLERLWYIRLWHVSALRFDLFDWAAVVDCRPSYRVLDGLCSTHIILRISNRIGEQS
jgi:hypothetical protein